MNSSLKTGAVLCLAAALLVVASACATFWRWWPRLGAPTGLRASADATAQFEAPTVDPPQIDRAGDDPAVAAAIDECADAVRRDRTSPAAWGKLGMVLAVHGFPRQAATSFGEAARLDGRDPRWPYFLGSSYCRAELREAIGQIGRAVELWEHPPLAARLRFAELLLQDHQVVAAQRQIELALVESPQSPLVHLMAARLARENENWPSALEHAALARDDRHTRKAAARLAAEVRLRAAQPPDEGEQAALADFRPDDPWPDPVLDEAAGLQRGKMARIERADSLLAGKRYVEAARAYRALVRDYPEFVSARVGLSRVLVEQNDLAAAAEAIEPAIERDPGSADAQMQLGTVLLIAGQHERAAEHLRAATAANPQDPMAWHNLGHALLRRRDAAGAEQAFRQALSCKPNLAETRLDLGKLLLDENRLDEGLVELRYAQRLRPSDPRPRRLIEAAQAPNSD